MKILHTGDLHIGRTINQHSLLEDQCYMLKQLLQAADEHSVDAVIIAGDIFDRSVPSGEAVKLVDWWMREINITRQLPILAVSGNHDGVDRLIYGSDWFKGYHLHLHTKIEEALTPVTLNNVDFYLIPYIEPVEARLYFKDDTIRDHQAAYQAVIKQITDQMNTERINMVVSHLFVQGGHQSDSERPLSIGTIEFVSENLFEPFDHVALGHLHHPFAVKSDTVFYSGSLLKYSFSEVEQPKGYRLITVADDVTSQFIPLTPLKDLKEINAAYDDAINDRLLLTSHNDYFKMNLSGMYGHNDPMAKLKQLYPNLLELRHSEQTAAKDIQAAVVDMKSDIDIINHFVFEESDSELTESQLEILEQLMKEIDNETH